MRPLGRRVAVERVRPNANERGEEVTAAGLVLPRTAKFKHPSKKYGATPDFFRARVIAVGPDVPSGELAPGDDVLVFMFAESSKDHGGLYTGIDLDTGKRPRLPNEATRLLVDYPDDFVCAFERQSSAAAHAASTGE